MKKVLAALISTLIATIAPLASAAECEMSQGFTHRVKADNKFVEKPIYEGMNNGRAFFFTSHFAVNTDGAPSSYHPEDAWGDSGKAINAICNGANVILSDGTKLDYARCKDLIAAYRQAKDAGWQGAEAPKMDFYGIATQNGRSSGIPCTIKSGPYAGFFVSTTAQPANPELPQCDPNRYLNALEIPFVIVPKKSEFIARGVGKRDVVVLYNPATAVLEYAIVGDQGPKWGLGEGSVFVAKSLRQIARNPTSRKDTYKFSINKVHALVLSDVQIEPPYTLDKIRREGAMALDAWGGRQRFDACIAAFGG